MLHYFEHLLVAAHGPRTLLVNVDIIYSLHVQATRQMASS